MVKEKNNRLGFNDFYQKCVSGKRRDPFRIISIYVSYPLYLRNISADAMTYLAMVLNIFIPLLMLTANYIIVGSVIIFHAFLNPIFDSINGNLARAYSIANPRGSLLDLLSDYLGKILFMLFFGLFVFLLKGDFIILFSMLISFTAILIYNILHNVYHQLLLNSLDEPKNIELIKNSIGKMGKIRPINKTDIVLYFFTQSTGQAFLFGFSLFLDIILNLDFFMRIAFIGYFVLYSLASVYALRRSMKMLQRFHTDNTVN